MVDFEQKNKIKNILLVGNGFDLSLGYKTSYKDFLFFIFGISLLNNLKVLIDNEDKNSSSVSLNEVAINEDEIINNLEEISNKTKNDNIKFCCNHAKSFTCLFKEINKFCSGNMGENEQSNWFKISNANDSTLSKMLLSPFIISFLHFAKFGDSFIFSICNNFDNIKDLKGILKYENSKISLLKKVYVVKDSYTLHLHDNQLNAIFGLNKITEEVGDLNILENKYSFIVLSMLSYLYNRIYNEQQNNNNNVNIIGWCDLEKYIALLVTGDKTIAKSFNVEEKDLNYVIPLNEQNKTTIDTYLEGLNDFIECFRHYLHLGITEQIPNEKDSKQSEQEKRQQFIKDFSKNYEITNSRGENLDYYWGNWEFDKVISFNYTDRFMPLLYIKRDCHIQYIHGSLSINDDNTLKENCDIVFGYTPYDSLRTNNNCLEFEKIYQKIHNNIENKYKKWIKEEKFYLTAYGFSFAEAEKDVVREILCSKNLQRATIYCYGMAAYKETIKNLSICLGKKKMDKLFLSYRPKIELVICNNRSNKEVSTIDDKA